MAQNAPAWKTSDEGVTVYAAAAVAANLFLVPDAANRQGVKTPVTSSTLSAHKGVSKSQINAGAWGSTFTQPGHQVVVKASGAITQGDTVFIDTAAGKEGRAKTYVNFATNGAVLVVGVAETTAVDGDLVGVTLMQSAVKTA